MTFLDPNPPEFPSLWAVAYGEDRYGLWQAIEINGVQQIMRWIEPGQFVMGSPETEEGRDNDEKQHSVTISQGYWLADTACTQALWQAVTGENPSHNKASPVHPVETVSWDDCQKFIETCNDVINGKLILRLPTEAEWEHACRAGSKTAYWWGVDFDSDRANNSGDSTCTVLQYEPNPNGLFQMHGNVREWCEDWFEDDYPDGPVTDPTGPEGGHGRVLRGGYWFNDERSLRSAYRNRNGPDLRSYDIGLRLAGG